MATVIQATNLNSLSDPAVSLSPGDFYYELPGIAVSTQGATAVYGVGFNALIAGSVFGATNGMLLSGDPTSSVTVATGALVAGGTNGILVGNYAIGGLTIVGRKW